MTKKDVGKSVYRVGRTSGKHSGRIQLVNGYANVSGRMVYGFSAKAKAVQGDSGGPVMLGSKAVGMVSGASGGIVWAAELYEGLKHLGAKYSITTSKAPIKVKPKVSKKKVKRSKKITVSGLKKLKGKKVDILLTGKSQTKRLKNNKRVPKSGKVTVKIPKSAKRGKRTIKVTSAGNKVTYGTVKITVK